MAGGQRLLSEFQYFEGLDRAMDILVVHAYGNNLGVRLSRDLMWDIKLALFRLWALDPGIIVVWLNMVARRVWRQARSVQGINWARSKVNTVIGKFVARNGGLVVRHQEVENMNDGLLWTDRVHLYAIGFDLWTLGTLDSIEAAVNLWRDDHI